MTEGSHWGVVGGGILGMTLAWDLRKRGHRVTLLEAAPEIGGLASAWQVGDVVWDRHYHVTLLSDSALRSVLRSLDLDHEVRWRESRTGFFTDGRLYSLSNSIEFLQFPALGLIDKLRLGFTIFYASRVRDWRRLERISVEDWLIRLSGPRTFAKIWLPLLRSKLGDNCGLVSASFIWATIQRLYAARREGLKKEMFGYVPGGYARVLDRFRSTLQKDGVAVKTNSPSRFVGSVRSGEIEVRLADGRTEVFDQVVVTTPAPMASAMCPDLSAQEHAKLRGVRYQGIVCASVLLKKPLAGFYVTNITDPGLPFTGVIEMSALVDRSEFGGLSLVYLPKYLPSDDPAFEDSDADWRARFLAGLTKMYPGFEPTDVVAFQLSRVRNVFALPTLGYSEKLPAVETSIPGVYILNSAHIVNGTLNVNETIQLARQGARTLSKRLVPRPAEVGV